MVGALALLAALAVLVLDLLDGGASYGTAGLATLVCGGLLVASAHVGPLPMRHHQWRTRATLFGAAIVLCGAGWVTLGFEARDGVVGAPALGDVATLGASALAAVGLAISTLRRNRRFAQRLFPDAMICGLAVLALVWSFRLGPTVGFDLRADRAAGLAVLAAVCLVVIAMAGIRLLSEPLRLTWVPMVAAAMISLAQVDALISRGEGASELGPLAVACWFSGWPLLTWWILAVDVEPDDGPDLVAAEKRELVLASIAPALTVVGLGAAVLSRRDDLGGFAQDPVVQACVIGIGLACVVREILLSRARGRLTAALRLQAELDPLTELSNRRGLAARVERLDPHSEWTILAVDLDGFKSVNDVLGHGVGDQVLAAVGTALTRVCPPEGLPARTGGDEFALLCAGGIDQGRALGERVMRAVEAAVLPLHLGLPVTASIGVGRLVPDPVEGRAPTEDRLTPLVEAGAALRAAKQNGGNQVQTYPGAVAQAHLRRLLVEVGLRAAIENGAITSHAQPLVDLATGRIVGVEALARWVDPVLGAVPPTEFVAVGEQARLIPDIGRAVLSSALDAFVEHGLAARGLMLSINVSPLELRRPRFADGVVSAVGTTGMPLHRLTLEVTEAVLVGQDDPALRTLADLASRGVSVAIDDFGAGYSALGYLRRLPVSTLKLDRSLVTESLDTPRTREIVAGVADLAARLHLTVVFEGIEDERTATLAARLGATLGQGFYFGRPMTWADLADQVAAQDAGPPAAARPVLRLAPAPRGHRHRAGGP